MHAASPPEAIDTWMNLLIGLVFGTFLAMGGTGAASGRPAVMATLIVAAFIGIFPTLEFDINIFGYERHGMRRLLLLPVPSSVLLRSVALASLLFGLAYAVVAIAAGSVFLAALGDPRFVVILLCVALSGLLVLKGVAIWTSVLLPRASEYGVVFRNQSGLGVYVVMAAGAIVAAAIASAGPWIRSGAMLASWWAAPAVPLLCAVWYFMCLTLGGRTFERRRERILAAVDRRSS
jgi:hypothetical protein